MAIAPKPREGAVHLDLAAAESARVPGLTSPNRSKDRPATEDSAPSKSQRKRDALALQSLGEALTKLTPGQLEHVPLSPAITEAVSAARGFRRGAYRRQVRLIGRLLMETDPQSIREAVDELHRPSARAVAAVHRLERWRERLIEEGDAALGELVEVYPHVDRQHVRQLVRTARAEHARASNQKAFRALFRLLRELESGA